MAVVFFASTSLRLMVLRRLLIFSGRSFLLNMAAAGFRPGLFKASNTSCLTILPFSPVALILLLSTFLSAMIAAATGVAFMSFFGSAFSTFLGSAFSTGNSLFSFAGSSRFCSTLFSSTAGFAASVSILQTTSPMASVSPSLATCFTIPACSAFTSNVAFSLSSSAITSSLSAKSPSFFSHFTSVTSFMLSPTVGTLISIAIKIVLFFANFG